MQWRYSTGRWHKMTWTIEQLGRAKNGSYFAYPTAGEDVTVKVSGEFAEDVIAVANQIEARVCVPDAPKESRKAVILKERFDEFRANRKGMVA